MAKSEIVEEYVWICNISKQSIPIQLKAPTDKKTGKQFDWLVGEQSVPLGVGAKQRFPKSRLYTEQIENLQRDRRIKVSRA
jgi:hypothetical protein